MRIASVSHHGRRLGMAVLAIVAVVSAAPAADTPSKAAIASAHRLATDAGREVLGQGGNAMDAAVAISAALSVVEPESSGLGGGGFWLIHRADEDRTVMVDGREVAPGEASRDMYQNEAGKVVREKAVNGPLAAGIPGEPAALVHIAERYGKLPLARSLAPAIRLAEEGFPLDKKTHRMLEWRKEELARSPAAAEIYLTDRGERPDLGTTIRNPDLAATLRALATEGKAGFYRGEVAEKLVDGVREAGGIWTREDLLGYEVVEREPIRFAYRDIEVVAGYPPSSGGVALATMLNILEGYDLDRLERSQRVHLIVEAMRRAYRDRAIYLGDPDFVDMPLERLTHDHYAAGLRAGIRLDRATPSSSLPGIESEPSGTDTTHFSVIDTEGNRVAATLSVNLPFGSAFMPPGTGVLLNDEMDDFSAKPGVPNAYGLIGESANAIAPGKRMLSSMTPTFVDDGNRVGVLGTPGGSRIITTILLGILDFAEGNGPQSWVERPRFHHQYMPDQITYEPGAFGADLVEQLEELGHTVKDRGRDWSNMQAAMWDRDSGEVSAASDPRWSPGKAAVFVPGKGE